MSMRVSWNGEVTETFVPTRGVRQGNLLSPYIFVLCIERLAHKINQAVIDRKWKLIKIARDCPELSHLFVVDDMILFIEAFIGQVMVI